MSGTPRVVREVDQQLALAAGIVDRDEPAGADRVRLRKQDQRRRELVHVASAVHAVAIEERVVDGILARRSRRSARP